MIHAAHETNPAETDPAGRRNAIEWVALAVAALAALVLGTIGLTKLHESLSDALYGSVQLFVLESNSLLKPPLSLEIARWLAPAVTAYAAVRAALVLFHEQFQRMSMRVLLRDHVVIAGLGAKGYTLALALKREGVKVVAIERDERVPSVAGCRRRDIPVVVGDAADRSLLARVRVDRARRLVAVTGDDRRNIEIAFVAQPPEGSTPLHALVHLDELALWRLLQAEAVSKRARLRLRLDFFNLRDLAARAMLEARPPFPSPADDAPRRPHVLIVESGRLGESLLLRTAGLWQASARDPDEKLRITLAGHGAEAALALLAAHEPALAHICTVSALDVQPSSLAVALGERPVTAVYICLDSEAEALAVALSLHARPALAEVPIVVAVADERSGISLAVDGDEIRNVTTFGIVGRTLTARMLDEGTSEALARAKHEHYVECERKRGTPSEGNPSMVPWEYLGEALKESNRRFADSAGAKLEAAGCAIVPAPLADPANPGFAFTEREIEELAEAEHARWCHDLDADGWRFGASKDPVAKRHPKLLPWNDLTEDDRDKDREPVAELPVMLARAGFVIHRGRAPSLVDELGRRRAEAAEELR